MNESEGKKPIVYYSRPNCPMNRPVLQVLQVAGARIHYVDIAQAENEDARQRVRDINDGNESVPTLVFPDGGTLTEPGANALRTKLQEAGYSVSASAAWRPYIIAGLGNPLVLLAVAAVAVIIRIGLDILGVL